MTITSFCIPRKLRGKYLFALLGVTIFCMLNGLSVKAQESTPLALSPGVPNGSYALSDIDSINLFAGRVNIHLPFIPQTGRGQASGYMSFTVDSPAPWRVSMSYDTYGNPFYYAERGSESDGLHSGGYGLRGETSGAVGHQCFSGFPEEYWAFNQTVTRLFLIDPDGTEHEMRDVLTNGQPLDSTPYCPFNWPHDGPSRGRKFVTTDGSGITAIFDSDVKDGVRADEPYPTVGNGWFLFKDGRRLQVGGLRDRNGNIFVEGKDSLNRTIGGGLAYNSDCPGYSGQSMVCQSYSHKGFPNGTERKLWLSYLSLTETRIYLPNGLFYRFTYNSYGDLTRLDSPTGGSIEYDYGPGLDGPQLNCSFIQDCVPGTYSLPNVEGYHVYRRVTERRVYREGHMLETRQTFSKPEYLDSSYFGHNNGYADKNQYDASDHLLSSERHYFYGSANDSFDTHTSYYVSWKSGREYRSEFYDANGNLLRRTDSTWEQRTPVSWWTGSSDDAPQNDPRISQTVSYLENGQSSTTTYSYDSTVPYNSLTDVYNYDYGGALLRHTQTTYLKTLNGVDYTGSNIQSGSGPHLRDFPLQVSVFDGGGESARTTYEYDNYNNDGNHAPLVDRSGISGFDSSFNTSYSTRGNVTATTRYILINGSITGSITAYAQYDIAGNVVKAIDPRGYATTFDFSDRFGAPDGDARGNTSPTELSSVGQTSYAFATSVTNALGQTAYAQFDYYLGTPVDAEDANGVVSSAYFNDSLDRPTQIIRGSNQGMDIKNQTSFSYDDTNRVVTTRSDLNAFNDPNPLKSEVVYDGLGRMIESRQYENGTQYIAVTRVPFVVLQDPDTGVWVAATQSSNPFRPYLGEQPVWTTTFSDALGRASKVRTPDNATVRTAYSGNTVTVTDQAGKQRKSVSDAAGRLIQVYEDPNGLNYLTSYEYDALDDLTKVTQDTQPPRVFAYDSLKRLSSATNPESGTVSYDYDINGNLLHRTDARSITTTLAYDALNRPTSKSYQNDPSGTPPVTYFYDSQVLPSGAPSYSRGYSTGRLVAVTYGAGSSAGDYYGFDPLGRPSLKIQQTGGVNYQTSVLSYNLAGSIRSESYPSGHIVSYNYDSAGRLSDKDAQHLAFTGNLGDGTTRTYSSITGSNAYDPAGHLTQEQFGTTTLVYNKLFYNSRQQLSEILASTAGGDASFNRGKITNDYSDQCSGASCNGTDNNGNLKKQTVFIPNNDQNTNPTSWYQQYGYDSLNRLTQVHEYTGNTNLDWQQAYTFDRYGNRLIDQANTSGTGIPKPDFTVNTGNNRLGVPNGQSGTMSYDSAGNLTTDTYTAAAVTRVYDAGNRMTSETQANNYVVGSYSYDGAGRRVKRNVGGVETWQAYGLGGELIAEYAQNGSASSPQKEYGYRNGQLLITVTVTTGWGAAPTIHDNPLVANQTTVQARHVTELRDAINALRSHLGMSVYSWQYSATTNDYISANPILEMRTALDQALGAPSGGYSAGPAQYQPVKAIHIQELRDRVLAAWVTSTSTDVRWLVTDQLGTPRMIFDQTGSLSGVSRHDYLPFGEELYAGVSGRTTAQGYTANDNVRQHFTGYEHDGETGLEFAHARYYASIQGRFTAVDPVSGHAVDPQTWNMYAYVGNNPINTTDPSGMNYFMGSGANDPFISEFRVDGFDLGPEGSTSKRDETQSLADWQSPLNQEVSNDGDTAAEQASDPQNAGPQGGPGDQSFARQFSDEKAIAAGSGREPSGFRGRQNAFRNNQDRSQAGPDEPNGMGHLYGYAVHLYDKQFVGTGRVNIYVPPNFDGKVGPGPSDNAVQFHYKELNGTKDVLLVVFHVSNFKIQTSVRNAAGNVLIGRSGGKGGDTLGYTHACIQVFQTKGWLPATIAARNNIRLSMRNVFLR